VIGGRARRTYRVMAAVVMATGVLSACAPRMGATQNSAASRAMRGSLFIVGGGTQPPALISEFIALAGGPGRALIAVVPMASAEPVEAAREKVEQLVAGGARALSLHVDRAQAEGDSAARLLDSVTGVWFSGGDQARLTPILAGTPLLQAIRSRYHAGAVIGGTSAGAAIMTDSMITGEQYRDGVDTSAYYGDDFPAIARRAIEIVPGLGFLPGAIVDQHFIRRERHNRLISVVLERPTMLGIGIDEGTALVVGPEGAWRVIGRSAALIYDARQARVTDGGAPVLGATDVRLHLVPAGGSFDPRSGRATLPGR
jgi:cyanophycinase